MKSGIHGSTLLQEQVWRKGELSAHVQAALLKLPDTHTHRGVAHLKELFPAAGDIAVDT
jgi:hypothetical protein